MPTNKPRCPDCGTPEGRLHDLFCTKERCPFCGGQLAACDCKFEILNLNDAERKAVEEYIDDSVKPLSGVMDRWKDALAKKGRIPFIVYPIVCAKCGALWPEFFRVPKEDWERYIEIDMRHQVICRPCFEYIKAVVDSEANTPYRWERRK